jgi:hypothetical protein
LAQEYKILKGFVSKSEADEIKSWVNSLTIESGSPNHHLSELSKVINGKSIIFDIANTPHTNYITKFQSISAVKHGPVPEIIIKLIDRIAETLKISKDHIFLQAVDMDSGGKIDPHYDASIEGYINYKCNLSVLSEDYMMHIDKNNVLIQETDLYCFEASLYKHWTDPFKSRRIFLSFGFILKYEELGRTEKDPRVRLSRRIEKYFQEINN